MVVRARALRRARVVVESIPEHGRWLDRGAALPRYRQVDLRLHRVLGISDLRSVPRDLVRQHGRRDVLHASQTDRAVGVDHRHVGDHGVLSAVLWSSLARREGVQADLPALRVMQPRRNVANAVHRGLSLEVRHDAGARTLWPLGDRRRAALRWSVGLGLLHLHGRIPAHACDPDDIALPRRSAGAGQSRNNGAAAGTRVVDVIPRSEATRDLLARARRSLSGVARALRALLTPLVKGSGSVREQRATPYKTRICARSAQIPRFARDDKVTRRRQAISKALAWAPRPFAERPPCHP